jgi:methyl-accepting chemotaxis protein
MSLKNKLITIVISSIVVTVTLLSLILTYDLKVLEDDLIQDSKQDLLSNVKSNLKNNVNLAISAANGIINSTPTAEKIAKMKVSVLLNILNNYYKNNKNKFSEAQIKENLKEIVKNFRYKIFASDKKASGYFWINDFNAIMIMHPLKPQLNGKNLINFKDKAGNRLFL